MSREWDQDDWNEAQRVVAFLRDHAEEINESLDSFVNDADDFAEAIERLAEEKVAP